VAGRFTADYLGDKLALDEKTRDVVRFGAENLFLGAAGLAAIGMVAWLLRCLPETLLLTGVVIVTRSFAGGAHLGGPVRCTAFTALIFPALGAAARLIAGIGTLVPVFCAAATLVSLVGVLLLAPADSAAKPIRTLAHRRRLKKLAGCAVLGAAVLQACLLAGGSSARPLAAAAGTGLLWQFFVLTRAGHAVMRAIDRVVDARTG